MSNPYPTYLWIEMKRKSPKELSKLMELCRDYSEAMEHFRTVAPSLTGYDIAFAQSIIHQIMAEYQKVVTKGMLDKDLKRAVQDDINKSLTAFFTDRGQVKPLTGDFRQAQKDQAMELHFPLFMAQFSGFINSRVFDCMEEAVTKSEEYLVTAFKESSQKKGGLYPTGGDKGFESLRSTRRGALAGSDDDG